MNILFHRGHVGFQESLVFIGNYANHAPFNIDNYIGGGLLLAPVSEDELDLQELGDEGFVANNYVVSNGINTRYLYWDVRGASVIMHFKSKNENKKIGSEYTREVISAPHIKSSVLGHRPDVLDYLIGLVYADATFKQIDQFCFDLRISGGRPFNWYPYEELHQRIKQSEGKLGSHQYRILRDGSEPSEHLPKPELIVPQTRKITTPKPRRSSSKRC